MQLLNSNTVERRMDLASLFCMIGRHGPAVALVVIAMVSVLAGFIIYRTVRGKRRKATAAAADGDGKSREADRDASVIQQSPEESQSSVESTDVSDEGSEVKEAVESDLKIRHRRVAAAEKTPPHYSSPQSDNKVPDNEHATSDDTQEVAAVLDSETYAEEANHSLLSDAEMVPEDVSECHQGETDDTIKDVLEEFNDEERCTKEPEPIDDEHHEEEEKVLKAESQECEDVTTDKDVSIKTAREEEDSLDQQLTAPRAETCSSTPDEETNLQATQQEQCDHVMDTGSTPIQGNNWDENGSVAGEEDISEEHLNNFTAVDKDMYCPHLSSISQDQQSDQMKKNKDFSTGAAPVMTEDINPRMCQLRLSLCDKGMVSAGLGEESGISSMNVSPDVGHEFDVILEDVMFPVLGCDLQPEAENGFSADDAATSVIKEDTAGMDSEHNGWTNDESLAANEDMFGHEIEDSYHRAVDQFAAQIADSDTSFIDEPEKQSDINVFVDVTEKKEARNTEKKEDIKEEEDNNEKTEISIMEATMDHNEWIMDSNYQALPWMNLCTKTNQLPTEECQSSSAVTDTSSTEVKQTSDETTEISKKVVAVQPMPQNVNVTFRVHYFTQSPYQTVAVTGSRQELGNWKGFIPLERAKDGHWAAVVSLPAESHVEWKFVLVDKGEVCRWEECGNRLLDTGFGDDLLVHNFWGRL